MTKGGKVHILGTGDQAPYGIGEIIAIFPEGHSRKIQAELNKWWNKPTLELHRADGTTAYIHSQWDTLWPYDEYM